MRRSKQLKKAIENLGSKAIVCHKCSGKGIWVFFDNSGECFYCSGNGMINASLEEYKRINEYLERDFLFDEMLHSNKLS